MLEEYLIRRIILWILKSSAIYHIYNVYIIDNLISYTALSSESAIRDVQYKQKMFFNQLRIITKDPLLDGVGSTTIKYIYLYIYIYILLVIRGGFQCQNAEHHQQSSASSGVTVSSRCPGGRWPEESVVLLECHGLQLYHLHNNRWGELYIIYSTMFNIHHRSSNMLIKHVRH